MHNGIFSLNQAEMALGRPIFPGHSVKDQLERIFKTLGTPTPAIWPEMTDLPDYKDEWPIYPPTDLKAFFGEKLDDAGIDLLAGMLQYCPESRISADQALAHPFFKEYLSKRAAE